MSIVHNIIGKRPIDMSRIDTFVSNIDGAICENRGEKTYHFWIDGKSTRGFEITLERDSIEVRNLVLSNRYDYELTNKIVTKILSLIDGIILNEEDEECVRYPIFDNDKITETEIQDCECVYILSKEHDVAICGPIRDVHFGKRMYKEFESLKGEQLRNKIFNLILTVNYKLPLFEPSGIMRVSSPENEEKIMKFLSEETDYILGKYDYILLHNIENSEKPIMITNEILNKILPPNWTLIDEYTIVAPSINQNEWKKLLTNSKKYDLWESFMENR